MSRSMTWWAMVLVDIAATSSDAVLLKIRRFDWRVDDEAGHWTRRQCSPRRRMPYNSANEGSTCVALHLGSFSIYINRMVGRCRSNR